jgi:integrase
MAPRTRDLKNKDLPDNVKVDTRKSGTSYYYYLFPDGTRGSLGTNREAAKTAANALNLKFTQAGDLVERVLGRQHAAVSRPDNPLLPELVDQFEKHWLTPRKMSDRTKEEVRYKLAAYKKEWPSRTVQSFTTLDLATFLNERPNNAYVKHRALLIELFGFACHQGFRPDNPAAVTMKKEQADKARQRHTWEGFQKIRAVAPEWLQRAMDLALLTLQRRSDLTGLHRTKHLNTEANTITIIQEKTRNYAKPVYIEIVMGPELRAVVDACLRSDIPCPYLIHTRPYRMSQKIREAKPHPFAVTPDHLTKQFAHYRDLSGAYDHLQPEQRPTLHEIRALGIWLYEKAGYPPEYIMALSGHAGEAMFEHYKEGHEAPKPVRVAAGLSMAEITKGLRGK